MVIDSKKRQNLEELGIMSKIPIPGKLLLVGDVEHLQKIVKKLENRGHGVLLAPDIDQAISHLPLTSIVIGFTTPEINSKQILGLSEKAGIPTIIFDGNLQEREIGKEVLAYLKRGSLDEIVSRIETAIGRSKKSDIDFFNEVEGIELYLEGKTAEPEIVFSQIYQGLQNVVDLNKEERKRRTRTRLSLKSLIEREIEQWKEQIPEAFAIVETPEGTYRFDLLARTNMDEGMIKLPNILVLQMGTNNLILRVGRTYPAEEVWRGFGDFGKDLNRKYYENMLEGKHSPDQIDPSKYLLIPEPYLLAGLEALYHEENPRITPKIKLIEIGEKEVYYLRPWLKLQEDLPLDYRKAAEHAAALHSYGLFEVGERNSKHYAFDGGVMVNIDPDYFIACLGRKKRLISDLNSFYRAITARHRLFRSARSEREFKRIYWDNRKLYGDLQDQLVEAIPQTLSESVLDDLRI